MLSINADQPSNHATVTSKRLPNPHIPQGDVGRGADPRILQQHASTETVSTVCFLPKSTHLLLAGISHRWLRLFDLRSPVPPTTNVSSKIQGIATDPFDPHRIACFGEGTVTLWDARRLQVPVLSFGERDASADGAHLRPNSIVAGVEFSSTRRGMLASLERDALYVRFWDILGAHAQSHDGEPSDEVKSSRDLGRGPAPGRKPWANLPWPSGSNAHQQVSASAKQQDPQTSIVLFDTRRTKSFPRPIASFALAPSPSQHPLTTNVMVVNKEGDLELYAIHDTPKPAVWSARGDLAVAAGLSYRILEGSHEVDAADDTQSSFLGNSHSATPGTGHHSRSREESILPGQQKSVASSNGTGKSGPVIPPPPQGKNTHLPLFGRGDEDGFPALGGSSSNLTAARPVAVSGNSTSGLTAHGASSSRKGRSDTHGEGGSRAPSISTSRVRRGSGARGIQLVMECDISMVMRKRALRGYGLSDPQHNMEIVRECDPSHSHRGTDMLIDLWAWIYHSHGYLSVPNSVLHGYDFGYQGLIGVWEGFAPLPAPANIDPGLGAMSSYFDIPPYHDGRRSHGPMDEFHGNFHAALGALVARRTGDRSWKPTIMTTKGLQRQICLQLVGWSLREDEMANTLAR
ncbi:hypothetical protein H0H81_011355 [Sphagnurus paluster]|uniref:Uncharacterized protein n=1 Tax=Sphagnurus paluster TaxID=117069 RepID=A0A9P7K553_9AGAR|nr:hypothetical protein H0H81_011355 [Sphagnurus paluster]